MRYKWRAKFEMRLTGFKDVHTFLGRDSVAVPNTKFRDAMITFFGTFDLNEDGTLKYVGGAEWTANDGSLVQVDPDGFVEIDWTKFSPEEKTMMEKELEPA